MCAPGPHRRQRNKMYFGDPEAQRHATDAARFLLRDMVIPRVTLSRLKRAHEGAEVERIYALAVGHEAEAQGLVEDPAGQGRGMRLGGGADRPEPPARHGLRGCRPSLEFCGRAIRSRGAQESQAQTNTSARMSRGDSYSLEELLKPT